MIELRSGDREAFFDVPFNIYGQHDNYVSPMRSDLYRMLDADKNPLFTSGNPFAFWTAHLEGKVIGRIIALVHRQSNQRHGTQRAQFGFFDCADDAQAAKALLDAAIAFARQQHCNELVGNFNLTAMQQCGVMTAGFTAQAYTDMVAGPVYLPKLLQENGFSPYFPMTTFELDLAMATPPHVDFDALESSGYHFAPIKKSVFKERFEQARVVLNDGFDQNPMFVPLTPEEFHFQAGEMSAILDPRLSSVLMHEDAPVGTVICIPDLNGFIAATRSHFSLLTPWHFLRYRLQRRRAVIIFYSVAREYQGRGLMAAMLTRTITELRAAGYQRLGITWIAEVNTASLRQMEKFGAKPLHQLHLFRRELA
jgi:GNAT superfamily N-acetyltransferase